MVSITDDFVIHSPSACFLFVPFDLDLDLDMGLAWIIIRWSVSRSPPSSSSPPPLLLLIVLLFVALVIYRLIVPFPFPFAFPRRIPNTLLQLPPADYPHPFCDCPPKPLTLLLP